MPTAVLLAEAGTELRLRVARLMVDGVVERAGRGPFTSCVPDYDRDEASRRSTRPRPSRRGVVRVPPEWVDVSEDEFQRKWRTMTADSHPGRGMRDRAGRVLPGDGEIVANPIGTIPMIAGRLARACSSRT